MPNPPPSDSASPQDLSIYQVYANHSEHLDNLALKASQFFSGITLALLVAAGGVLASADAATIRMKVMVAGVVLGFAGLTAFCFLYAIHRLARSVDYWLDVRERLGEALDPSPGILEHVRDVRDSGRKDPRIRRAFIAIYSVLMAGSIVGSIWMLTDLEGTSAFLEQEFLNSSAKSD